MEQTIEIGTCITYLTDSVTIKNCWYWPDTDTDTRNWCSPTGLLCCDNNNFAQLLNVLKCKAYLA